MKKYNSYEIREKGKKVSDKERELMDILMEFGDSIDYHGSDGGDYDTAMDKLLKIIK